MQSKLILPLTGVGSDQDDRDFLEKAYAMLCKRVVMGTDKDTRNLQFCLRDLQLANPKRDQNKKTRRHLVIWAKTQMSALRISLGTSALCYTDLQDATIVVLHFLTTTMAQDYTGKKEHTNIYFLTVLLS